jgi:hypothetical protein
MKFTLLTAFLVLIMSQAGIAFANDRPPFCPAVEAFQNTGISDVRLLPHTSDEWIGVQQDDFGTENKWTLIVGYFSHLPKNEMLVKANAVLSELELMMGVPNEYEDNYWVCQYINFRDPSLTIIAITPDGWLEKDISKLSRYLKK